jgi:hypothetical protein
MLRTIFTESTTVHMFFSNMKSQRNLTDLLVKCYIESDDDSLLDQSVDYIHEPTKRLLSSHIYVIMNQWQI